MECSSAFFVVPLPLAQSALAYIFFLLCSPRFYIFSLLPSLPLFLFLYLYFYISAYLSTSISLYLFPSISLSFLLNRIFVRILCSSLHHRPVSLLFDIPYSRTYSHIDRRTLITKSFISWQWINKCIASTEHARSRSEQMCSRRDVDNPIGQWETQFLVHSRVSSILSWISTFICSYIKLNR